MFYNLFVVLGILLFWRDSLAGPVGIMQMSFGDGMAEPIGRALKGPTWPFSSSKSVAGTLGFFFSAFLGSVCVGSFFLAMNGTDIHWAELTRACAAVSLCSALAEAFEVSRLIVGRNRVEPS